MNVKIIADSTCDLSEELLKKYDISILPLHIVLGELEYKDGLEISPDEIYEWSNSKKEAPKTSAASIADAIDLFDKSLKEYNNPNVYQFNFKVREKCDERGAVYHPNKKMHLIASEELAKFIKEIYKW